MTATATSRLCYTQSQRHFISIPLALDPHETFRSVGSGIGRLSPQRRLHIIAYIFFCSIYTSTSKPLPRYSSNDDCILYIISPYTLELRALMAFEKALYPSSHLSTSCPCNPTHYRSGGIGGYNFHGNVTYQSVLIFLLNYGIGMHRNHASFVYLYIER
jgi:hypothetical protein